MSIVKNTILATAIVAAFSFNVSAADEIDQAAFYSSFYVKDIPADSFQSWPYYGYASMNIKDYLRFGVHEMPASSKPAVVKKSLSYDLATEFNASVGNIVQRLPRGFDFGQPYVVNFSGSVDFHNGR